MTTRTDIINLIARLHRFQHYLEIGVRDPRYNYDKIKCRDKVGVDPDPKSTAVVKMTSDAYFAGLHEKFAFANETRGFQIVFIDGLHTEEQVDKDIANALKHLTPDGVIILHDCNPPSEWHQRSYDAYTKKRGQWNGTVWRSFVKLRMTRPDMFMYTVDTDFGVGVIRPVGSQKLLDLGNDPLTYATFAKRKRDALKLVTVEQFQRIEKGIADGGIQKGQEAIDNP
jgi:hypothetical protein